MSSHSQTPYPAYKPTAIPWLPQVPKHWQVERAKGLFMKVERPVRPEDDVVTCFRDGTVTLRKNRRATGYTESLKEIGYQGVRKGDLVIHVMDAFAGSVGVSDSDGKSTPVYSVCVPRGDAQPWYYTYVLRQMARAGWILALAKGIRERSSDFRFEMFGAQLLPVPPVAEQHLIVRYLRALDAKVKRYIRTKRTLIARLQEQKQAIIQRAVTRGLDPNVKLKPSSVEWLGEVPEHWEVKRGKAVFEVIDKRSKTGNEELLSVSAVNGVVLRSSSEVHMFMAASYVGHKLCWPEDLVINSLWAWAKGFGFSRHHGIVSTAYSVYRLRPQYKSLWEYLDVLLRSGAYDWDFTVRSRGVWKSRLQLTDSSFLDMRMILPSAKEADEIVEYVRTETKDLDEALNRVNKEIEVLQEYHVRLIADVVTGAVDVREAARNLPEENEMISGSDDLMVEDEAVEPELNEQEE